MQSGSVEAVIRHSKVVKIMKICILFYFIINVCSMHNNLDSRYRDICLQPLFEMIMHMIIYREVDGSIFMSISFNNCRILRMA